MKNNLIIYLIVLFLSLDSNAMIDGGLILSGLDTLDIPKEKGFDFIIPSACTSSSSAGCVLHFDMVYYSPNLKYTIFVHNGYSINKGKLNLDSIKVTPNDSAFTGNLVVDSIPPDSLSSRVGNCYILKTATDPRSGYKYPLFAKIKILKIIVIDSAQHQIKMVFLWGYNDSGIHDLTTSGLDTFHLDGSTINQPNNRLGNSMSHAFAGQYVFKVVGDRFVLPQELVGKVKYLTVWDLRGRRVGKIQLSIFNDQFAMSNAIRKTGNGDLLLEMPRDLKGKGMFVVRGE